MQTKSSEVIDYLTPLLLSGLIWYNPCENELVARNICKDKTLHLVITIRAVSTWLSKGIGFGFGFTTPFGWLVYLLWFWFYDSQVKTALSHSKTL